MTKKIVRLIILNELILALMQETHGRVTQCIADAPTGGAHDDAIALAMDRVKDHMADQEEVDPDFYNPDVYRALVPKAWGRARNLEFQQAPGWLMTVSK